MMKRHELMIDELFFQAMLQRSISPLCFNQPCGAAATPLLVSGQNCIQLAQGPLSLIYWQLRSTYVTMGYNIGRIPPFQYLSYSIFNI